MAGMHEPGARIDVDQCGLSVFISGGGSALTELRSAIRRYKVASDSKAAVLRNEPMLSALPLSADIAGHNG